MLVIRPFLMPRKIQVPSACDLITRWEREGIVRGGQPRIELIDEDRLRRIAQREPEQRRAT